MITGYEQLTDGLTLVGLLTFPAYALYWFGYHLRAGRRRRLWAGALGFVVWCAATWFCFLDLMFGCMGGHCGGRVSPFLEFSIAYAVISIVVVLVLHFCRSSRAAPRASL